MYVEELVQPLLQTLIALTRRQCTDDKGGKDDANHNCSSSSSTIGPLPLVLVAHGRNRPAEPSFKAAAARHFSVELMPSCELDEVYQCSDVDALRLRPLRQQA